MKLDNRPEQLALAEATARAPRPRLRLGDMLVAEGVITPAQLQVALDEQRVSGRKIGQILIEDGVTDETAIARALAQQLRVPFVELNFEMVASRIAALLPEAQARRLRALPVDDVRGVVRVAMADPTDLQAFDEVHRIIGRETDLLVVTETALLLALDRLHAKAGQVTGFAKELELEFADRPIRNRAPSTNPADEAPVVKLLQSLFEEALRVRASDIHVEPQERKLQIRLRIDGALVLHTEAEAHIAPAVLQRLKLMAGLDIAERRLPQDGRFATKVRNHDVDMRISTMPTQYGESAVLRLLPHSSQLLALDKLGLPPGAYEKVRAFIGEPHGMMLVTGPTGSGKTSTLYSVLAQLNAADTKIITVEDPVEYRLPGINQVQVNEKIGLSFATVLRSTLRQDPDIVLVGEMRDPDTVETGLRAAMTGHMVLSTLHTNDAASTPVRLIDMGAPAFLVATSLRLVLAQRLVRMVCTHCARPAKATPQEHAFLRAVAGEAADAALSAASPLRAGAGCAHCGKSGYFGRHGVYEALDMSPPVVEALHAGNTQRYTEAARREIGPLSLARHACDLALAGRTTVREAMRTVGPVHE
ncbi:MAG TPA: ATPase, T2SS/T4P/T4SS family [Burkholderiaceae bacterium]|nr:ATPase, T2SS/T4P/T4SS family [Burkholderiaceae bacterium]